MFLFDGRGVEKAGVAALIWANEVGEDEMEA